MDFKVAGTADGITALQMDIKVSGITTEIMRKALEQARRGGMYILGKMQETLAHAARPDVSTHAPRIVTIRIPVDKIRDVIGPGGKMIRSIIERTGVKIDVEDDGRVNVASADEASAQKAIGIIQELTATPELNKTYMGKVQRITDFGAFVEIMPGLDGLLHVSEIAHYRVKDVRDELKEGEQVMVKVINIDPSGKIRLSRKALLAPEEAQAKAEMAAARERAKVGARSAPELAQPNGAARGRLYHWGPGWRPGVSSLLRPGRRPDSGAAHDRTATDVRHRCAAACARATGVPDRRVTPARRRSRESSRSRRSLRLLPCPDRSPERRTRQDHLPRAGTSPHSFTHRPYRIAKRAAAGQTVSSSSAPTRPALSPSTAISLRTNAAARCTASWSFAEQPAQGPPGTGLGRTAADESSPLSTRRNPGSRRARSRTLRHAKPAMTVAVREIQDDADRHPDDQPLPGRARQPASSGQAHHRRQQRQHRHPRHPERTRQIRPRPAQDDDADRHDDERHQRADADERAERADRRQPGGNRDDDAGDERRDVRRVEARMDARPPTRGIRPSFAIDRKMRGCASIITTITELSAGERADRHAAPSRAVISGCP